MEVTKIISIHFLIAVMFIAHGCISQHWSHGWLPGGKRSAVSMDAYLEMINDEDVITDIEIPRYQYLYQRANIPQAIIPDLNDRKIPKKRKLQSNLQQSID
ncbi:gonadotropin-releasing hormone 3 [Stegostoma tigrinum]|uniref:gonadotropin-releasing hormone 3 n=1 Tax=Stegostoma tigrinum TaxID=3053191 RepID=UPI00202B28EA|nr:gonadotropin-releasing hormone 3 [Stegostoma tigrinum]